MDDLALLRLQIEWGADEALDDAPLDRLRTVPARSPSAPPSSAPPSSTQTSSAPTSSLPPAPPAIAVATPGEPAGLPAPAPNATIPARNAAIERATAAAAAAATLDQLRAAIAAFDGCVLRDTATKPVLPTGDAGTGLLLIGEAPGADEDRAGTPFAGADGALLDRMLASIRVERAQLLAAPLIPWRPPGGRPPSAGELAVCLPFLHRLIALARPRLIVLLGALATRTLLGSRRPRPGAGWTTLSVPDLPDPVPALVLPAPAMLAGTPTLRRIAWLELRRLRRALDKDLAET